MKILGGYRLSPPSRVNHPAPPKPGQAPLVWLAIVASAVVSFGIGMWQKWPCHAAGWPYERELIFGKLCYSDLPVLYTGRGLADGHFPYATERSFEYPVLTGYLADVTARLVTTPAAYYLLNSALLLLCTIVTAWATVRLTGRIEAGLIVALSPALIVTATINWDMVPVMLTTLALLAWSRDRPELAGLAIGLGAAAKFYPALLLFAFLLSCDSLRRRCDSLLPLKQVAGSAARGCRSFGRAAVVAVAAWLVVNLPVVLLFPQGWLEFFRLNQSRPADFGSAYYALQLLGYGPIPSLNTLAMLLFGACLVAIALYAPRDVPVTAFLTVAAFLVTNKVYSPQYVLWLIPLAVVAGASLLYLALWQLTEIAYWWAVWHHLLGTISYDGYAFFVFLRIAAVLVLATSITLRSGNYSFGYNKSGYNS